MAPVTEIFVHHEGAGDPTDDVERFGGEGYTVGVGTTRFAFFRTPAEDFATKHFNHVSLAICLSGNRDVHEVTDADLMLVRAAMDEARARGLVTADARIRKHKDVKSTACPGAHTCDRWDDVVDAVKGSRSEDDDVKIELLIPDTELTAGDFVGKRPTIARIIGTPIAFHVGASQVSAFTGVPVRQVPVADFMELAVFDVKS
jgi:hypothetical protein